MATINVPLVALSVPGEAENTEVAPAVGDTVTMEVSGVVESVTDGEAVIRVTDVNGESTAEEALIGEAAMPMEPTEESLLADAAVVDANEDEPLI